MNIPHEIVIAMAKYAVVIPVIAIGVVFLRLGKKQRLHFIVYAALAAIFAYLLAKLAAHLHQDPRPFVRDGVAPYFAHSADNGFPSEHTLYSALIACIVIRYHKKLGAALLLLAILIGTARVIAGVHHGQDIAAGVVIAALGTAGAYLLQRLISRRSTPSASVAAVRPAEGQHSDHSVS